VHLGRGQELTFALDDSVGGAHDAPTPGELFCAALAASVDSAVRLVAARMSVGIERLAVIVTGDVDSRGVLGDTQVPVGFQSIRLEVQLRLAAGTTAATGKRLLAIAERHCEVLQTLMSGVRIRVIHSGDPPSQSSVADGR